MINYAISLANTALALAYSAIASANLAFNNAVNWARTQIGIAVGLVNAFIIIAKYEAISLAISLVSSAVSLAHSLYALAIGFVVSKFVEAELLVIQIRNYAIGLVVSLGLSVFAAIEVAKIFLIAYILGLIAPFFPLINYLSGLISSIQFLINYLMSIFTPGNVQKLLGLLDKVFPFVTQFMNDPIGFLVAYLEAVIWPLIQYTVAYALGSTVYDLPPKPNFGGGYGIDVNGAIVYLPARNPELGQPVTPLYISGNRFNPDHQGTDYGLHMGQEVYACHDGIAHWNACGSPLYGNCLVVSGSKWKTVYAHLQDFAVPDGFVVRKGQLIAHGDSTGNSTGPHLHLEVIENGIHINPESVI